MNKKKKIGIVTITNSGHNFGNRLQNYALQTVLERMGYDVETLNSIRCRKDQLTWKQYKKAFLHWLIPYRTRIEHIKSVNFFFWNKLHIHWAKHPVSIDTDLNEIAKQYDYFVAGSDQIWNPHYDWGKDPYMYLQFARPEQRVAYAASIGVDEIEEPFATTLSEFWKNWKAISSREESGSLLIEKVAHTSAPTLLDPTLLLTTKEWSRFCCCANTPSRKYIFVYMLGNTTEEYAQYIEKLAKENRCCVVDVMNDIRYAGASPTRFAALIKDAQWVVADSYHAFVFAMIFKKNFTLIQRQQYTFSINSRMTTLIQKLGLSVDMKQNITEIINTNWNDVEGKLQEERYKSIEYLKSNLI